MHEHQSYERSEPRLGLRIVTNPPTRTGITARRRTPSPWASIGGLLLLVAVLALLGFALKRPNGAGSNGLPAVVDGLRVQSVSEVLMQRGAGAIAGSTVAVGGYWSSGVVPHACAPDPLAGELEIRCADGEFGITDLNEAIFAVDHLGHATLARGPHLTPWFPADVAGLDRLFTLPVINGQRYRPVPIVVVGHFDDPRSEEWSAAARKLCNDRLVVDRIASFDPSSVATPAPSPSPTPFPSPAPSGLFDPSGSGVCAGRVPYSFVGWTTTKALSLPFDRDGEVWAAVTVDTVPLGDEEWITDPATGEPFRWWGRMICLAVEGQSDVILYGAVPGSTYKELADGATEMAELP